MVTSQVSLILLLNIFQRKRMKIGFVSSEIKKNQNELCFKFWRSFPGICTPLRFNSIISLSLENVKLPDGAKSYYAEYFWESTSASSFAILSSSFCISCSIRWTCSSCTSLSVSVSERYEPVSNGLFLSNFSVFLRRSSESDLSCLFKWKCWFRYYNQQAK